MRQAERVYSRVYDLYIYIYQPAGYLSWVHYYVILRVNSNSRRIEGYITFAALDPKHGKGTAPYSHVKTPVVQYCTVQGGQYLLNGQV